jgi:hypothetical protein
VEAGAGEDLGGFHFSEGGTEKAEAFHEVGDQIRELVYRFG